MWWKDILTDGQMTEKYNFHFQSAYDLLKLSVRCRGNWIYTNTRKKLFCQVVIVHQIRVRHNSHISSCLDFILCTCVCVSMRACVHGCVCMHAHARVAAHRKIQKVKRLLILLDTPRIWFLLFYIKKTLMKLMIVDSFSKYFNIMTPYEKG